MKIYLDRNVDVKAVKNAVLLVKENLKIEFIQWPLEGKSRRVKEYGLPAGEITWNYLNHLTWDDFHPTDKYEKIVSIVGKQHRCDCIHFDIAIKNGCSFYLTSDKDFLLKGSMLETVSGIRIYNPANSEELESFLTSLKECASASALFQSHISSGT
jgi:hypothetical protein